MSVFDNLSSLSEYEKIFYLENCTAEQLAKICSLNKEWFNLCYNSAHTERIFKTRSKERISEELLKFKEVNMSWKDFYTRIYKFQNNPQTADVYCRNGALMELEILLSVKTISQNTINYLFLITLENGNLEILKYLLKKFPSVTFNEDMIGTAIIEGHLNILKYGNSLNPPVLPNVDEILQAANFGHVNIIKYLLENHLELIDVSIANASVASGNIELVKYLMDNDIYPDEDGANRAVWYGKIDMLKFLATLNPPIYPVSGADIAVNNGHLDMLKYLHEHHIDVLHNSPRVFEEAVEFGNLDILKYLVSIGIHPYDKDSYLDALSNTNNPAIEEYLDNLNLY